MKPCRMIELAAGLMVWLSLVAGVTPVLRAQPVVYRAEAPQALSGHMVDMSLHGKGFRAVRHVDAVKIGALSVNVKRVTIKSDDEISVRFQIPKNVQTGRYKIAFKLSGDGFAGWYEPRISKTRRLRISGKAEPEISVTLDRKVIKDGQRSTVEFGVTRVGAPVEKRFTIENHGLATLRLRRPSVPPGFRLTVSFPDSVGPDNGAFFYLELTAEAENTYQGKFQFETNARDEAVFDFTVTGTVTAPEAPRQESAPVQPPVLFRVASSRSRPGSEIPLRLLGQRFLTIDRLDSVQIGGQAVPVLDYTIFSDTLIGVRVRLPETIPAGRHDVAVFVSGKGFGHRLEPARTTSLDIVDLPAGIEVVADSVGPAEPARPTLDRVEAQSGRINQPVTLTLHGQHFSLIDRIRALQIGEQEVPVLDTRVESDGVIRLRVQGLPTALSGREVAFLASGPAFELWLELPPGQEIVLSSAGGFLRTFGDYVMTPVPPFKIPLWVVLFLVVFVPTVALLPGRFARRKLSTHPPQPGKVPMVFKFEPKKDRGAQQIAPGSTITPRVELRLKPLTDRGRQAVQVKGALVLKEETVPESPQDDLTRIEGIGPVISGLLQTNAITTFAQLAATDLDRLRKMLDRAGIWFADPGTWPEQASLAAANRWQELQTLQEALKGGQRAEEENV